MPVVPLARYSSDKETFMLEDDSGRIKLTGPVLASRILVTGIVVAVLGTQKIGGEIEVEEFALPDVPPQRSLKGFAAFLVSLPPPTAPHSSLAIFCLITSTRRGQVCGAGLWLEGRVKDNEPSRHSDDGRLPHRAAWGPGGRERGREGWPHSVCWQQPD